MSVQDAYNHWSITYDTVENWTRDLDGIVTTNALRDIRCDTILELGCGTGKNTLMLAQLAKSVQALDFSQEMIAKAKVKVAAENVRFFQADLTRKWPSQDQSVDLIVCNLVLEHIEDLKFIFSEASRSLGENGRFFISELHPSKQYQGTKATFTQKGVGKTEIPAFIHHVSDFLDAASENGLSLLELREWWHEYDQNNPPRLITFMFEKKCS